MILYRLGVEFAGEIAAVGNGVTTWHEGDRVMGHGRGGQAQYVLADPRAIMPVPAGMSWAEAASFPNVFITAHDAVVTNGQLRAGESILVNAASGGVGSGGDSDRLAVRRKARHCELPLRAPRSSGSRRSASTSPSTPRASRRSTRSWRQPTNAASTSSSTASAARYSRPT